MLKPIKDINLQAVLPGIDFQIDAVESVRELEYSALFHEQGLGKTKIGIDLALTWLREGSIDCIMIVTKRGLIANWEEEFRIHTHFRARVLTQDRKANFYALNTASRVFLLHYEVVRSDTKRLKLFLQTRRVAVILDEAQKIKNPESALTKAFHELGPLFVRRVIMTGTPVANRPADIWSQIFFLDQGKSLGSDFVEFEASVKLDNDLHRDKVRQKSFQKNLSGVFTKIASFCVRETKDSASIHLPEKTITTIRTVMEPKQSEIYAAYREEARAEVLRDGIVVVDDADAILKRLLRLVQVASNPHLVDEAYDQNPGKVGELTRLVEEAVDDASKIIVWTSFVDNVDWLCELLAKFGAVKVHGQLEMDARNRAIEEFKNNSSARILVATPGAAKEGLTLTVANHAIFYDRSFSLDDYLQAQDRIHRISQEMPCYIWTLISENTVDEWVDALLSAKRLAAQLLQADISETEFETKVSYEFGRTIARILSQETTET